MEKTVCENSDIQQIAHLQNGSQINTIIDESCNLTEKEHIECAIPLEQFEVDDTSPFAVPEKRCYTVEDIQAMLCISRPSVYKLISENHFHTVKVAGKHRISKKSFDKWFDNFE